MRSRIRSGSELDKILAGSARSDAEHRFLSAFLRFDDVLSCLFVSPIWSVCHRVHSVLNILVSLLANKIRVAA
jgi:hypothetical protein